MKRLMWAILLLMAVVSADAARVIKVLAIGNSFSEDAVEQYLYELAAAQGDSLVIGNAYIGGCSIDHQWSNAQTGKPVMPLWVNVESPMTATAGHWPASAAPLAMPIEAPRSTQEWMALNGGRKPSV